MISILFALLAGIVTIAAPCALPVLPILLGASVGQTSRARPVFVALGFVVSFATVVVFFSAITQLFGFDQNTLRDIGTVLLLVFGLLMLWPRPFEWFTTQIRGLVSLPNEFAVRPHGGRLGGFVLGTTLGLVWTPCSGPVLASILTVIATSAHSEWGAFLLVMYAIGAAVPMLMIAYGGQFITTKIRSVARISHRLQQGFGVLVIAFAMSMYLQYDVFITLWLSDFYSNGQIDL